ncbi:FAD-dependent oxidoreductase, partial [Saccharomonospora iraqiensis]|uniref:FAD-dependent oxidoreductase n=1 Tax=Saccharomonospora iraqiensis TaxID=52698 RepID=UPI0005943CC5
MTSRRTGVVTPVSDSGSQTGWEAAADLVVLGSGVAGLTAALRATELGLRVLVVSKGSVSDGNTRWAQGGVAAVLDGPDGPDGAAPDSVRAHAADTVA